MTTPSPILGLLTPTPHALSAFLLQTGFIIRPVVPPTVPLGGERVRICLRAGMEREVLDRLVSALGEWVDGKMRGDGEGRTRERGVMAEGRVEGKL
jgi:8-amino-7-oxononanoate synthase